ncbi:MAG: hypothetical protein NVS2B12_05260 [Ktedonobacteraceae bacterium]
MRLTRRGLLWRTSIGVAALSGMVGISHLPVEAASKKRTGRAKAKGQTLVLVVHDIESSEVSLMFGEHKKVFKDTGLVSRLVQAAK